MVSNTNLQYSQFLCFYHLFNIFIYLFNVWNYFRVHIWWLCSSYKSDSYFCIFCWLSQGIHFLVYIFKLFFLLWTHVPFDFIYGHSLKLFKDYYSKKKKKAKTSVCSRQLFAGTYQLRTNWTNFCLRIFLDYSGTVNYGLQTKVNTHLWVRNSQMKCLEFFFSFFFKNNIQIKVQDTKVSFVGMAFLVCPLWVSSLGSCF